MNHKPMYGLCIIPVLSKSHGHECKTYGCVSHKKSDFTRTARLEPFEQKNDGFHPDWRSCPLKK